MELHEAEKSHCLIHFVVTQFFRPIQENVGCLKLGAQIEKALWPDYVSL
jgi:hypothetical protein